jgi:hypothetical protein
VFDKHLWISSRIKANVSASFALLGMATLWDGKGNPYDAIDFDNYALPSTSCQSPRTRVDHDARTDIGRETLIKAADSALLMSDWLRCSPMGTNGNEWGYCFANDFY